MTNDRDDDFLPPDFDDDDFVDDLDGGTVDEEDDWAEISNDELVEESDDDFRIYLPQVAASAGNLVVWRECDVGLPSRLGDRTLGGFLRQRLGLLDDLVRNRLLLEHRSLGVGPNAMAVAALGRAYGLDLRPGDDEVCQLLTADELEIAAAQLFRPPDGSRWLFEAGAAGLPRLDDDDSIPASYRFGTVPLLGLFVPTWGETVLFDEADLMSFEDLLGRIGQMSSGGSLVLVPASPGLFVRVVVPVFEYVNDRTEEVGVSDLVVFFDRDTDLDVSVCLAQGVTARYLMAQMGAVEGVRREPGQLRLDEILYDDDGQKDAFPTADLDHTPRNLDVLGQEYPELNDGVVDFANEQVIKQIEAAARLAEAGEPFSVELPVAGTITCLTDRIPDAA